MDFVVALALFARFSDVYLQNLFVSFAEEAWKLLQSLTTSKNEPIDLTQSKSSASVRRAVPLVYYCLRHDEMSLPSFLHVLSVAVTLAESSQSIGKRNSKSVDGCSPVPLVMLLREMAQIA